MLSRVINLIVIIDIFRPRQNDNSFLFVKSICETLSKRLNFFLFNFIPKKRYFDKKYFSSFFYRTPFPISIGHARACACVWELIKTKAKFVYSIIVISEFLTFVILYWNNCQKSNLDLMTISGRTHQSIYIICTVRVMWENIKNKGVFFFFNS